jgi:formylglycine-generating enzyme
VRSALVAGLVVLLASSLAAADVHPPDGPAAAVRRRRRKAPASPAASATARGFVALKTPAPERVLIRGGTFMMGSTDDEIEHARMLCKREPLGEDGRCRVDEVPRDDGEPPFSDEASQHEVMVSDFWLDRTEVTNARYRRCVAAGRCALPPYSAGAERFDRPELPVILVNWPEAVAFCEWDGGRLPTEAEWERAARGLNGRRYPWGEVYNPFLANHGQLAFDSHDAGDGFFEIAPVGSFPDGRTPEGLEDMAGNVWEWVGDWYGKEYPRVSAVNPKGPEEGDYRVLRGGSYSSPRPRLRGSARNAAPPGLRETTVGFRCARSL